MPGVGRLDTRQQGTSHRDKDLDSKMAGRPPAATLGRETCMVAIVARSAEQWNYPVQPAWPGEEAGSAQSGVSPHLQMSQCLQPSLLRAALPFLTGALALADRKDFWPSWKGDEGSESPVGHLRGCRDH